MQETSGGATAARTAGGAEGPAEALEKLPDEIERLSGQVAELLEAKLALLKAEVGDEIKTYLRDGAIMGAGGLLALVGFTLLSSRLPKGTGLAYMLVGGATVLAMKERIARRDPVPRRSAEELEKDRRWLQGES